MQSGRKILKPGGIQNEVHGQLDGERGKSGIIFI